MNTKQKIAYYTLGCKLNFSETATISRVLNENFNEVDFNSFANIYIINTCSVTQNADKEFKTIVKKALSKNSDAYIVAIGCYAQLKPKDLLDVEGVDLVLGSKEKFNILKYLLDINKEDVPKSYHCQIGEVDNYNSAYSLDERTRSFLKVQDGCDYKCTYCTIPLARGISRSDSLQNILTNAQKILDNGIKEIVLTGVNIGDYGKGEFGNKKHSHTFLDLLLSLNNLDDLERVRISSIEPNLLTDEIIELVATSKKFVPHFHIPLQSGSDDILKKMKRRYLTKLYKEKIKKIKKLIPNVCIGVDVIVGFPGETDEHFLETYHFLKDLGVSYLHVFTYSERANTIAESLENSIPIVVRKKRSKMLRILSTKLKHEFYKNNIGTSHKVLFESQNKNGKLEGFTENYIKIKTDWTEEKSNTLNYIKIINICNFYII